MSSHVKQPAIAISDMFFDATLKLNAQTQRKVQAFITKFRQASVSSGINYEKIVDAATKNFRSARIDENYRAIIYHPDEGNVYLLLWVDAHDDAYRWARTHKCEINEYTGVIQIYVVNYPANPIEPVVPVVPPPVDPAPVIPPLVVKKLFEAYTDEQLFPLGVPKDCLPLVRGLSDKDELMAVKAQLPADAFEALVFLADGMPYQEVLEAYGKIAPAKTLKDALERERTRSMFIVIEDDEELRKVINASLEKWRVFLHPDQDRLVHKPVDVPALVRGSAGTGKTVVAIHRAANLVKSPDWDPKKKLLFTTFTRNLAIDIEQRLRSICTTEQFRRIEVVNIDRWVSGFLKREGVNLTVTFPGMPQYEEAWKQALEAESAGFPETFYREEWVRIIQSQNITGQSQYLRASRKGRGRSLTRKDREAIWPVFEEMRVALAKRRLMTPEDAYFMASGLIDSDAHLVNYGAVIVDETQDLSSAALMMLARVAGATADTEPRIFMVGDSQQRIYARTATLSACGINVRGRRSERLKVTYRTTEQIRRSAEQVLVGEVFDDMDGNVESLDGNLSYRCGSYPFLYAAQDRSDEVKWIKKQIDILLSEKVSEGNATYKSSDICVVVRRQADLETYDAAFRREGLSTRRVSRDAPEDPGIEGIRIATMHRVKGLEFKAVFIAGADDRVMPLAFKETDDETETRMRQMSERSLFYVAASRARDVLFVSCANQPGKFFKLLEESDKNRKQKENNKK